MSQPGANEAALNVALGEYLGWSGDPIATLSAAVEADPDFILGHTTIAALNSLSGVRGDAAQIRNALAAATARAGMATPRERLHLSAARAWAAGDIVDAATFWEAALKSNSRDLLALRLAHDTHFYLGASEKLRDVPLSVLSAYDDPQERGFVLGMAAFGLEETGSYENAQRAGHAAIELNPEDSWAIHAVAHVFEMQDRAGDGLAWLQGLEPFWAPAGGLAVHQWWHTGLFLIELGRFDEVLALYDDHIRGTASSVVLDLVDAAALLWRLELLGVDVGARWKDLAPIWTGYAEDHVLAFNDVHIGFTLAAAGDEKAVDRLEASIVRHAGDESNISASINSDLGLPLIRALRAFRAGDYARTVDLLGPIYKYFATIGGSNAQRDLFIQTLGIAAFRSKRFNVAQAIIAEREKLKSGRPLAWARYATAH